MQPQVPIDVDETSGIWRTDELPMVYLPRHFLVNNHLAVEEALGRETYRAILRQATAKSAIEWCEAQVRGKGLDREATFRHYFQRLSQRGWGQFSIDMLDVAGSRGSISLRNSIFALEAGHRPGQRVCYMFEGFVTGALSFLLRHSAAKWGKIEAEEIHCACEGQHDHCRFDFSLAP
ncbi:4-vinyl reductase [Mesorhizobium sp. B2-4-17]|uniref:4-vinyl reductase n=1 Tax=Mesorhizobium sp. B2-4-17 TaxID=2589932 RepID=UPI00112E444F|nr:4-vinyl reductase [Mesorhizobium sp. B2-4-17]TPK92335.1 4-vinyl reductase [Mesorhizobium sp. B2-4-17]